jgi:hypothetical protein
VQHHLDRVVLRVVLVSLGPVVADSVCEDRTVLVERSRGDATANVGVSLQAVLSILVPEVEGTVGTSRAECAVDGVE